MNQPSKNGATKASKTKGVRKCEEQEEEHDDEEQEKEKEKEDDADYEDEADEEEEEDDYDYEDEDDEEGDDEKDEEEEEDAKEDAAMAVVQPSDDEIKHCMAKFLTLPGVLKPDLPDVLLFRPDIMPRNTKKKSDLYKHLKDLYNAVEQNRKDPDIDFADWIEKKRAKIEENE